MASPSYLVMKGDFVIIGKEPDGDSVRFIADDRDLYRFLHRAYRIKPSRDGSVQLRFEGVDAPELHYGSAAQPLGAEARDTLLPWMGFDNIVYVNDQSTMVKSADPASVPGAILTQAAEANGRPVSYIFLNQQASQLEEGTWVNLQEELLKATINYRLLTSGMAYYTVYTSTPFVHRQLLHEASAAAREAGQGVWQLDTTSDFVLGDQSSIGPNGQLILPKLFRRCTDFLKDVARGYQGNLSDWLIWISKGSRNENDLVAINDTIELHLSDLLEQRNRHIVFKADLLDITFLEK
ncbi:MAG: thermonuclease family protein [Chloroflexi bacterium]|nr:MAG: thermonuclease family protein [Chloroflexota bacterium]